MSTPELKIAQRISDHGYIGVVGRIKLHANNEMASKPVVLPEPFNGETPWDEWTIHFGNVADVNGWDADKKLQWLKVRLTGRAQKAFQRLPEASRATFDLAKEALTERFEPKSRKTQYQAEFQARKKKPSEGWADFADDLQSLAEKAKGRFTLVT